MKSLLLIAAIVAPGLATANSASVAPASDFVFVQNEGSLTLRQGPSTDTPRLAALRNGTLLRNLGCLEQDEVWCEVESLDAGTMGWVSADFLAPFHGADPAALDSPGIEADRRDSAALPARLSGNFEPGEVIDVLTSAPADRLVTATLEAPENIAFALFGDDGTKLAHGDAATPVDLVLLGGGDILIRLADRSGAGGTWSLDVGFE